MWRYCSFLLCVLGLNACSQIPLLSTLPNWQVPSEPCNAKQGPSLGCSDTVTATFDDRGALWVAWVNGEYLYVQHSDRYGRDWSKPVKVNQQAEPVMAHDEYRPKILVDVQGNVYLSWNRSLEKRHTGHVRFSRSTDGGQSFSEPVTINDNLDVISHRFDSMTLGKKGEIFIAWLDARDKEKAKVQHQEHLGTSVYYTWSDDAGAHFYPNQTIAAHSCECCRLATAVDADNHPVVAWRHVYPGSVRDHALIRFEDWKTPGTLQRLGEENWKIDACPHHGPALVIGDDDRYHSVWFSGAETKQGLYYAFSDDHGVSTGQPLAFGNPGAKHPHVGVLGARVAIVWMEFDGKRTLIRGMQSSDNGLSFSQAVTLAETDQKADYAFVLNDDQDLYLSWQTQAGYRLLRL